MRERSAASQALIWLACFVVVLLTVIVAWHRFLSKKTPSNQFPNPGVAIERKALPSTADGSGVPALCSSTNEIISHLADKGIRATIEEIKYNGRRYYFVLARSKLDVDTADLYYFVQTENGLVMFLRTGIDHTGPGQVDFKVDGEFIDVVTRGVVVLKINPDW